ncbi:MAG TPA: DUF1549 domain-containing protein [Pirellulales bacterium]|jgi:hypothetical protein|nr:DUF1549 domain-containing protein [Pirellulales bacterium]
MRYFAVWVLGWLTLTAAALAADKPDPRSAAKQSRPTKAGGDFFEQKIRPVLVEKCYQCHSSTKGKPKGGLALDTHEGLRKGGETGAILVAGDPESSLLVEALRYEGLEMPPKEKLPDELVANFAEWIRMGAPDPRKPNDSAKKLSREAAAGFWAYQPPQRARLPAVRNSAWPKNDVDRFILAVLETKNLKPVAEADRYTLLRRLSFDLTGLPPTPEDIAAFQSDSSPQAVERVVDRLLASPQFGERWGRHWLDVARYGESTGKERNYPFSHAWRYRDWVIDAVNADKPYDRFITEQIAGDLLPASTPEEKNAQLIATGFLALGPKSLNERDAELYLMDQVDDQIDVVCRTVLATTVGCARCHDHKFDPIPTADYYALAGIFRSSEVLAGVAPGKNKRYSGQLMPLVSAGASTTARIAVADEPVSAPDDRSARLLQQAKAAKAELKQLRAEGEEKNAERIRKLEKALDHAREKLQKSENSSGPSQDDIPASELAMGVRDRAEPADCQICIRGEVGDRGTTVPRGFASVLTRNSKVKINPGQSGRLELAEWLTERSNPLTARVMANRIWYHLLGEGLVESLDNFGALGETPTHPALLDALALYLMDHGWSVKQTVRFVVLSRTYQLSSAHDEANYAVDPANQMMWRANRRRLDAEAIRDAALAASGRLDLNRPTGSMIGTLAGKEIGRKVSIDEAAAEMAPCRSIYLPLARNSVPEMLAVFDVADPSLVVGQRDVTTVATQALFLMNSKFILDQCGRMARQLWQAEPSNTEARIDRAYRAILSRSPSAAEQKRAARFLNDAAALAADKTTSDMTAWSGFCQVLFASAEFRYLY